MNNFEPILPKSNDRLVEWSRWMNRMQTELLQLHISNKKKIHVKVIEKECECLFDIMCPTWLPDYTHRTCSSCKGLVSEEVNDAYNQYFGYSGYDEE